MVRCASLGDSRVDHPEHFATHEGSIIEWANSDYSPPVVHNHDAAIESFVHGQVKKLASGLRQVDLERRKMAVARRGDPTTSWDAARGLGDLTEAQNQVWGILVAHGPLMDEEIERHAANMGLGQSPSGLRSRRAELVAAGLVRWTGRTKRKSDTGNESRVWEAVKDHAVPPARSSTKG